MKRIVFLFFYLFISTAWATIFTSDEDDRLQKNFSANITDEGAVIASPSRYHPDYYYHWVRDAAISMDLIETWYEKYKHPEDKKRLLNYVSWVERIQHQTETLPGQDILGEPKFYLNSRAFDGAWGRPQNDGPALRALTLTRFANALLKENDRDYITSHLYGGGLDPLRMGVIKMDLEYIAHHWQEKNYDLWEEVYGHHFFNAMVQRKALLEGAVLARQFKEEQAASYYELQANLIKKRLNQHIDLENEVIQATIAPHPGPQKTLELDSAVILAVLLGNTSDDAFAPENVFVKNTIKAIKQQFTALFPINEQHAGAILFGRYPGDTYDGYGNNGLGNPWFILTATMAEYYYTLAARLPLNETTQSQINNYVKEGDEYLRLIKLYAPDLNISEQINRTTGNQQGANSLTWSYVAVLRAINLRKQITSWSETQA